MDAVLLDTDVLSFFAKNDTRAAAYEPAIAGRQLCISFQTVAELQLWALVRRWGASRRAELDALLASHIVLHDDADLARRWADITAHRRRIGRPIECGDAWIAATALRHDIPLATHNAGDYEHIHGLKLITHPDARTKA